MTTVFVAGSRNIKNIDTLVKERLERAITSNCKIVLGDASGADSAIQSYLKDQDAQNIVIYCSGSIPRNNLGHWPIEQIQTSSKPGTRDFFTEKDMRMASISDYGLMVWDTKSSGTLKNTIELLKRGKPSVVFVNKSKTFKTIRNISDLEELLTFMSEQAFSKCDKKIGIQKTLQSLKNKQQSLFN